MSKEAKIITAVGIVMGILVIGIALLQGEAPAAKLDDSSAITREYSYRSGPAEAKVKMVEFADFQCPACASFNPVLKQVLNDYPDQVSLTFRHFPLPSHPNAKPAAYAAEAAGKQGKFWEMNSKIYETQNLWANLGDPYGKFEEMATQLQLNIAEFKKSYEEKEFRSRVEQDNQDGIKMGVNSTPTLIINDQKYTGSLSIANLKKAIEEELKK